MFVSEAAQDWATLLLALDSPTQGHVRAATLTCFFGWSVTDLARADDDALIDVTLQVRGWRRVLQARGVAALMEAVTRDRDVAARLLGHTGGARRLTDLRHLAELLHDAATRDRLGPGALLEWFTDRVADAHRDAGVEGSRRLDAEGRQVTVVTVHRSKGLQYPIVYLPDAGDRWVSDDRGETLLLHPGLPGDPGRAGLVLDVGGTWAPGRPDRFARRQAEEASEDLRLLYVALTRAQCQVVTWWTPTYNTVSSALQRVVRSGGGVPELRYGLELGDPRSARPLGPHVRLEPFDREREPVALPLDDGDGGPLRVRTFDRALDLAWRRTSYSSLTAAAHGLDLAGPGCRQRARAGPRGRRVLRRDHGRGGGRRRGGVGRRPARRPRPPHRHPRPRAGRTRGTPSRPWPTCPAAPTSGRRSTPCSRSSTRERPTWPRACAAPAPPSSPGPAAPG